MSQPANGNCLNCGTALSSGFCPECGQKNSNLNISIGQFLGDMLEDIFNFDSRVFRTLVPLLFKPGYLTEKYNGGQRVRFVPPVRLFVIISLVYFFTLALTGLQGRGINIQVNGDEGAAAGENGQVITFMGDGDAAGTGNPVAVPETTSDPVQAEGLSAAVDDSTDGLGDLLISRIRRASEHREEIVNIIYEWLARVLLLLIPVFALLLKLGYRGSGYYYLQHLVFGLHYHSFVILLAFFLLPVNAYNESLAMWILAPLIALYLFLALKRVYRQPAWKTALKFVLLGGSYLVIYGIATLGVVIGAVLLYE